MKLSVKALALLTTSLLLTSCTPPTRMATPEQQQTIENEFWTYLEETINNTGTEPTQFIYGGGVPYDLHRVQTRAFDPRMPCHHESDGTDLYDIHVMLTASDQNNTKEEYKAKIQKMRQIWESQGHQVQKVGPHSAGEEIKFTTEAGVSVKYRASEYAEIIEVRSACILPEPTQTPTPTSTNH